MTQLTLEQIKKIEVEILDYVDSVCKKHNIQYYLAGGTLIGAVRHKGFIPWDDDIDLFMKREDYERFIACTKDSSSRFVTCSLDTHPDFYYPFVKVIDRTTFTREENMKPLPSLGVWLDIFPLDSCEFSRKDARKFRWIRYKYYMASVAKYTESNHGFFARIVKRISFGYYHRKNPRVYAEKMERMIQQNTKKTDYLCLAASSHPAEDTYLSAWFEQPCLLRFAEKEYPAPMGYDEVLTHRYGDYMTLPPEEQRVSVHNETVHFLREDSDMN